jgi:hypothetical protein
MQKDVDDDGAMTRRRRGCMEQSESGPVAFSRAAALVMGCGCHDVTFPFPPRFSAVKSLATCTFLLHTRFFMHHSRIESIIMA